MSQRASILSRIWPGLRLSAAGRIAVIYVALAAVWIVASDRVLLWLLSGSPEALSINQTFKGLAFVAISALLIYVLVRRATRRQRRVEDALMRSAWRFDLIAQEIEGYSIFLVDVEGRVVSWNRGAVKITGYRAEEMIGQQLDRLYLQEDRRAELPGRLLQRAAEEGHVFARGWRIAKDGRRYLAEIVMTAVHDAQGRLEGFVNFARDVTDEQALADKLQHAQDRLALGLRSGNIGLWDWDILTDQLHVSPEWKQQLGFADTELNATSALFYQLLHPDDAGRVQALQDAALRDPQIRYDLEIRLRHKDGSWRWIHSRGQVLRDDDGRPIRMIGVHSDVTQRRETEAQLRQALRMEAIGQLTGGVAHDFNNLLTVVLGNAELLRDRVEADATARQLAETTLSAAERGAALTRRLLAFARRETLAPERVNPNRLVSGVLPLLVSTLGEDIEIATDLGAELWDVLVDPHQLENSLINLVVNARDALPDGGHVVIATRKRVVAAGSRASEQTNPGDYVEILVVDDGNGMPPDVVERAFEPFFTTKDVGKGSGLGLSMVYGFVRQSGGLVEIESRVGQGTTVRILLPRAQPVDASAARGGPALNALAGRGERVLVVEDDEPVRRLMAGLLRDMNYKVLEAGDGPQALEVADKVPDLDLLVTDMVMPGGMNGVALASRLRGQHPNLPVLYVSGYSDRPLPGAKVDSTEPHADGTGPVDRHLGKPFNRRALARAVRQTLEASRVAA